MKVIVFTDFDDTLHNYTHFLASYGKYRITNALSLCYPFENFPNYINYPDYKTFCEFLNWQVLTELQELLQHLNPDELSIVVVSKRKNARNDFPFIRQVLNDLLWNYRPSITFENLSNLHRIWKIYKDALTEPNKQDSAYVLMDDNPLIYGAYLDLQETLGSTKVHVVTRSYTQKVFETTKNFMLQYVYLSEHLDKRLPKELCTFFDCHRELYIEGLIDDRFMKYRTLYPLFLSSRLSCALEKLAELSNLYHLRTFAPKHTPLLQTRYNFILGAYLCN